MSRVGATQVTADLERCSGEPRGQAGVCEPYRAMIAEAMDRGRNATAIWQDLVDDHGFDASYESVKRFCRRLRGGVVREAHPTIVTAPGEEGQVDYGTGPKVRHPESGKYRRTRLFVLTLGHSRKAVWLLRFESSSRAWSELHEEAFRRLGGAPRTIVLDNLKEGVLKPDVFEPELNPLYAGVLAHYGVVPPACARASSRSQGQGRTLGRSCAVRAAQGQAPREPRRSACVSRSVVRALCEHVRAAP